MNETSDGFWEVFSYSSLRRVAEKVRADAEAWFDLRFLSPLAVLAGLNCVGCLLLIRGRAPGTSLVLSDLRLCAAATAAALLAMGSRWSLAVCQRTAPAFWIKVVLSVLSVLPLAVLFLIASPRNSLFAVSFVCALAVVAANVNLMWKWSPETPGARFGGLVTSGAISGQLAPQGTALAPPPVARIGRLVSISQAPAPVHSPAEWSERTMTADGEILVRGRILAHFEAGSSQAAVHIPFQPPFAEIPEFSCELEEPAGIRLRSPAVFRYGARLELKRQDDTNAGRDAALSFRAVSREQSRRAA